MIWCLFWCLCFFSVIPVPAATVESSSVKVEGPEHPGLPPPSQVIEVSGHPGPGTTAVPPQVLPDSTEVFGVVRGGVPPVGVPPVGVPPVGVPPVEVLPVGVLPVEVLPVENPPVGVLPGVMDVVDIVPGEVPPVGGLPDSMQVSVNSGEVPSGDHVSGPIQVGAGHGEVPPVDGVPVGGAPERLSPGARHAGRESTGPPRAGGRRPPLQPFSSPPCHIHQ